MRREKRVKARNEDGSYRKMSASDYVMMKNNLDAILKERGMTASELAQKTELDISTISLFRNMKANISLYNIYGILEVLNISIGELFGEIPVNYKSIINIRYIEKIDNYNDISEIDNRENYILYGIDRNFLNTITNSKQTSDIVVANINNNSMYDTISTTDLIVLDLAHKQKIDKNGLYLVLEQGHFEIRRVLLDEERNEVNISPDNKKFMGNLGKNQNKEDAEKNAFGKVLRIIKKDNV
jgi:transcriptional regulator with XRE-family HTH domain